MHTMHTGMDALNDNLSYLVKKQLENKATKAQFTHNKWKETEVSQKSK